jgi:hypothetical protein
VLHCHIGGSGPPLPGKKLVLGPLRLHFRPIFTKKLVLISKLHVYEAGESVLSVGICIILINFLSIWGGGGTGP